MFNDKRIEIMKKMYKKPEIAAVELQPMTICNVSPGVNHTPSNVTEIE